MISGFNCFKFYLASKLHFTTDEYDIFESKARVSASQESYNKRRDVALFNAVGKKFQNNQECVSFMVANFAYGLNPMYDAVQADRNWTRWKARRQAITHIFLTDVERINSVYGRPGAENASGILQMFLAGQITIESVRILDDMLDFSPTWKINPLVEDPIRLVKKIKGFVPYNKERIMTVYNDFLQEHATV